MAKTENTSKVDLPQEAQIPAYRFDTINATCKLDRIIAAVNLTHATIGGGGAVDKVTATNAWLTLELVQEKLEEFRRELEDAQPAEVAHA